MRPFFDHFRNCPPVGHLCHTLRHHLATAQNHGTRRAKNRATPTAALNNFEGTTSKRATKNWNIEDKTTVSPHLYSVFWSFLCSSHIFFYRFAGHNPTTPGANLEHLRKKYSVTQLQQTSIRLGETFV
jgi:hypothetical protein